MRGCGPCPFRCPSGRQSRRPIPHPCWAAVLVAVLVAGLGAVQGGAHETVQSWAPHRRKGSPPTRLRIGEIRPIAAFAFALLVVPVPWLQRAVRCNIIRTTRSSALRCGIPGAAGGLAFAVRGPVTRWGPPRGRGILRRCGDGLLFGGRGLCRALLWWWHRFHWRWRCFAGLARRHRAEKRQTSFTQLSFQLSHLRCSEAAQCGDSLLARGLHESIQCCARCHGVAGQSGAMRENGCC